MSIWNVGSLSGVLVTAAVLGLFGYGMLWALRHRRRYEREIQQIDRARANLVALQEAAAPEKSESPDAEEPTGGADLTPIADGLLPESLTCHRLDSLRRMRSQRVRIQLSTLQELTLARDMAMAHRDAPHVAASLCLMLGVLGTFIGLAAVVQQIQLGLPGGEAGISMDLWMESVANIRRVLGGMKTAFATSLYGMTAAVLSHLLARSVDSARARFFEGLERFTVEELLPATVPVAEDEALLERVSLQLETAFDRIEQTIAENRRVLAELSGMGTVFSHIVDEVQKVTRSDARQDLVRVVEQLGATNRSLLELVASLPSLTTSVERGHQRLQGRIDRFITRWFPAGLLLVLVVMLVIGV